MRVLAAIAVLGCNATPPLIDAPIAPTPVVAPKDPFAGISSTCRGAALSFDSEEREDACLITSTNELPTPPDGLEITAVVVETSIKQGAIGTAVVTMTNKTTAPMLLHVDMSCDAELAFSTAVLDATHKRVDYIPHNNCNRANRCTPRVLRIVLDPGGSLRKKHSFSTTSQRGTADCEGVAIQTLKPGSYTLRVVTNFPRDRRLTDTTFVVK